VNSTDLTPAWILRAAAAYLLRHGLHIADWCGDPNPADRYDWSTDPRTPAATPEGAITIVVHGHPLPELHGATTGPDWDLHNQAMTAYLRAGEPDGYQYGPWTTPEGVARQLLWAALVWELDRLTCPVCGDHVVGDPLRLDLVEAIRPIPTYIHYHTGTVLCPVLDADGVHPSSPLLNQGAS
jgi:hypothetical protein